jgi:hypothetical protein
MDRGVRSVSGSPKRCDACLWDRAQMAVWCHGASVRVCVCMCVCVCLSVCQDPRYPGQCFDPKKDVCLAPHLEKGPQRAMDTFGDSPKEDPPPRTTLFFFAGDVRDGQR